MRSFYKLDINFKASKPFKTVYDDTTPPDDGEGTNEGEGGDPGGGEPDKTFTKDEVEAIVRRERTKFEQKTKKAITELETLKQSKSLTEQEQSKLSEQINTLQNQLLTKEELAKKEKAGIKSDYEAKIADLESERDDWKVRFTKAEISRSISDAATSKKAFRSEDIHALLRPHTELETELNESGEETGRLIPKVNYESKDKDGKTVFLKLTPQEAVNQMYDDVDQFGHLFAPTSAAGLGRTNQSIPTRNIKNMTHEEYRKQRKKRNGQ